MAHLSEEVAERLLLSANVTEGNKPTSPEEAGDYIIALADIIRAERATGLSTSNIDFDYDEDDVITSQRGK